MCADLSLVCTVICGNKPTLPGTALQVVRTVHRENAVDVRVIFEADMSSLVTVFASSECYGAAEVRLFVDGGRPLRTVGSERIVIADLRFVAESESSAALQPVVGEERRRRYVAALGYYLEGDAVQQDYSVTYTDTRPLLFDLPAALCGVPIVLAAGDKVEREAQHLRYALPLDRPCVRPSQSYTPESAWPSERAARLVRVHEQLSLEGGSGTLEDEEDVRLAVVDGDYLYYHYDSSDSGWGCAYRSLQTIASWFALHHYTTAPPPSHEAIQRALVECGERTESFIHSREWIGSVEVALALEHLAGVRCHLHPLATGDDLQPRVLCEHFEQHGTPVMVGGGTLAQTLLGVEYCEASGDTMLLVLDPHYVGGDRLDRIAGKWCVWKRPAEVLFSSNFYNLCLPQRPREI